VRSFAFVKIGDFSSANERILGQLCQQFPDLEPDVIDLQSFPVMNRSDAIPAFLGVLREYGPLACLTRSRLRARAMRTRYYFEKVRAQLLQRLSRKQYAFTFQTQSLFDASVPGTPHFVYTDHTHLANLTYPAGSRPALASRQWRQMEKSVYTHARLNFTMSSHIARSLIEDYDCAPSAVQCVYAGSNVMAPALEDLGRERFAQKRILFVGIDWERKGGPALVEAFREVRRSHPTAELVIVGCTPRITVPGCRIVGRVPLSVVSGFYRSASVFCLPTTVEPFGFVFLEAFAHGLPIVASDIAAIPGFVEEGLSGHMVACNDVAQLAQRLNELLGDPARCAAFGARGRALVRERYTWQLTGERIAAHIRPRIGALQRLMEDSKAPAQAPVSATVAAAPAPIVTAPLTL
jgi:hypothetical protein